MKTILSVILSLAMIPLFAAAMIEPAIPAKEVVQEASSPSERYYSSDGKYSIAFPAQWELAADLDESSIAGISPREDGQDFFRENVLIGSFDLTTTDNLDDYFQGNLEYLQRQIGDIEVESQERVEIDGQEAIKLIYSSTISNTRVKTVQVFLLRDGRGYIITAMAMEPAFEAFKEEFGEIIKSFRFE